MYILWFITFIVVIHFCLLSGGRYFHVIDFCACFIYEIFCRRPKNKTDQLLLTSPVSLVEIVLGKYLAMVTVFAIPCVIYCIFPLIIKLQGTAHFLVDYSSILAFFLLGCVFIAIGMFLSSLTESPVIAAITTCAALFFFYLLDNLLQYFPSSAISNLVIWIIIFALIGLLIYHITKNQMIAGIVTGIGCIAGIVVYFVKKTLLESLFSTLLGHLVLTDIFIIFLRITFLISEDF